MQAPQELVINLDGDCALGKHYHWTIMRFYNAKNGAAWCNSGMCGHSESVEECIEAAKSALEADGGSTIKWKAK